MKEVKRYGRMELSRSNLVSELVTKLVLEVFIILRFFIRR